MIYVYDIKEKRLTEVGGYSRTFKLSKLESKLLEVLSNGYTNTWWEITNYIYKCVNKQKIENTIQLKRRLLNKINLKIKTIDRCGLILKDKIYIM